MSKDGLTSKPAAQTEREARQAAQLRENLKRRKAQARARQNAGSGNRESNNEPS